MMRVVMVAHPAFLFLAAYLTYTLHTASGLDPLLALPVTVPLFFALGVAVQRLLVARLAPENLPMMSVLLTFGLALVIEGLLGTVYTGSYKSVSMDYATRSLTLGAVRLPYDRIVAFAVGRADAGGAVHDPAEEQVRARAGAPPSSTGRPRGWSASGRAGHGVRLRRRPGHGGGGRLGAGADHALLPRRPLGVDRQAHGDHRGRRPGQRARRGAGRGDAGRDREPGAGHRRRHVGDDDVLRLPLPDPHRPPAGVLRRTACATLLGTRFWRRGWPSRWPTRGSCPTSTCCTRAC
ncbi:hypothetical protein [Nonomuraea dietziae]|uniref:branched-chain amino acid ABC transporter permease n=1 Tax=Nonomuraea dietziae TaxID=65515 RepID=UPI0031DD5A3F